MKFFFIALITSFAAFADDPQISVQGACEMKVVPDRGMITFSVENQDKNQKVAVNKTHKQIEQLKKRILNLGLTDLELKNTNYTVFPVREYEKERFVDKGIRAALTLEVITSDIPRIGETMMVASKVGIQNVGSLQTFLSPEKSRQEYLKCLDIAANDARAKAKRLAKRLGFQVGDVINLNEMPNIQRPIPMERGGMMKTMSADVAPTQVEAGTLNFSTNIQVTFSIK